MSDTEVNITFGQSASDKRIADERYRTSVADWKWKRRKLDVPLGTRKWIDYGKDVKKKSRVPKVPNNLRLSKVTLRHLRTDNNDANSNVPTKSDQTVETLRGGNFDKIAILLKYR